MSIDGLRAYEGTPPNGSCLGMVYVLINQAMPDMVKIGMTSRSEISRRLKELDTTGVPLPFECYCAYEIAPHVSVKQVETALHHAFGDFRVRKNREFFKDLSPDKVEAILKLLGTLYNPHFQTQEDKKDIESYVTKRRDRLTFDMLGIPVGSTLYFAKDKTVTCVTKDNKNSVLYNGSEYSLSAAALDAVQKQGSEIVAVQGGLYWMYSETGLPEDAETLVDIRKWREGS